MPFAFADVDMGDCVQKSPSTKLAKKGILANPTDVKVDSEFCKTSIVKQCANYPILASFQIDRFGTATNTITSTDYASTTNNSNVNSTSCSDAVKSSVADRMHALEFINEWNKDWTKGIVTVDKTTIK